MCIRGSYATLAVGLGMGLSPFLLLSVGLALVAAYLVLSINVYLETYVFGEFRYGYGIVGPTEARLLLMALNTVVLTVGPLPFDLRGIEFTLFDIVGTLAAVGMSGLLLTRVGRNLRKLGRLEPPNVVRDGGEGT